MSGRGVGAEAWGPARPEDITASLRETLFYIREKKAILSEFQPPARSERSLGVHFWWPVKDVCPKLTFALPVYGG